MTWGDKMITIVDTFNRHFEHWNIKLHEEDVRNRSIGYIHEAGWLIQYCFGKDENGEYLDYYAAHRMTDDSHIRIHEDGKEESLPALDSIYLVSEDPVEAKRLKDEYYAHNREVSQILVDKGFDKFTINMYLHAGLDKEMES
jgi:hypothetical protein